MKTTGRQFTSRKQPTLHQSWLLVFTMGNDTEASPNTLRYFFMSNLEHSCCLQDRVRDIRLWISGNNWTLLLLVLLGGSCTSFAWVKKWSWSLYVPCCVSLSTAFLSHPGRGWPRLCLPHGEITLHQGQKERVGIENHPYWAVLNTKRPTGLFSEKERLLGQSPKKSSAQNPVYSHSPETVLKMAK